MYRPPAGLFSDVSVLFSTFVFQRRKERHISRIHREDTRIVCGTRCVGGDSNPWECAAGSVFNETTRGRF